MRNNQSLLDYYNDINAHGALIKDRTLMALNSNGEVVKKFNLSHQVSKNINLSKLFRKPRRIGDLYFEVVFNEKDEAWIYPLKVERNNEAIFTDDIFNEFNFPC